MTTGGGVASAFGFRYQYLVTVEILLELFERSDSSDWVVDVDRAQQDSADIMVYSSVSAPPDRVIQVKASLAESSTTMGVMRVRQLLTALKKEHPASATRELVTNRTMTAELQQELAAEGSTMLAQHEKFKWRKQTLHELTETLLKKVGHLRSTGAGGLGLDLQYLLLRQLVDMVHEAGSRPIEQRITREAVRKVIEGTAPVLSDALGARRWGMCIQVPTGNYIERPRVTKFLRHSLPNSAIYDGTPKVAAIHGLSGTGKTSAASFFARSRLEHLAFVLWLDASSTAGLKAQLPVVLNQMGTRAPVTEPSAEDLMVLLGELPVPWLLILDGAQSLDDINPWVPRSGYGQTLITTAHADWPTDFAPTLRLDGFNASEARYFFAERFNQPESLWSPEQSTACEEIAKRLAYWPLALELVASWIQRRGGSLEIMRYLIQCLERLNLDDTTLLPHGYPKTATQVILDLLDELSPPATLIVSVLLLLGGDRVPERLITDLVRNLDLMVGDPLEELFAASVVQRGIAVAGTPHDYDETVTVHDFLKLVAGSRGVKLDDAAVFALVETCEQSLTALFEKGCFRECATLVYPIDHLLRELVESVRDEPLMLIRLSILMHNLAQVAVLTANVTVARTWFIAAFNVRRTDSDQFKHRTEGIQMQLQTLAGAAMVMARRHDVVGMKSVAEHASDLMKGTDGSVFEDPQTLAAVQSLCENVALRLPNGADRMIALRHSIREDGTYRNVPPGHEKVRGLQNEMQRAVWFVETDHWQQGVDAALAAANHGQEENLLVDLMVDGLLDVGLLLIAAIARRQHDLPDGLLGCLQRVAAWFLENPIPLDEVQQQRVGLLQGSATGKPSAIRAAVADLPGPEELTLMVSSWSQLTSAIADQLDRFHQYEMFANLSDSVTIEVGVDGGDDINFWQEIQPPEGTPMLWVCTSSRIRYDAQGKSDPVREMFIAAGLPQPDHEGKVHPAHGWLAILRGDALTIHDGDGTSKVIVGGLNSAFCERIHTLGGLVLIYGDRALTKPDQDPPPVGWVPLAMNPEPSQDAATAWSPDSPNHNPHVSWLERLLTWWKRVIGTGVE